MKIDVNIGAGLVKDDLQSCGIRLGRQEWQTARLIDRWPGTGYCYYKVATEDGASYLLRHDEFNSDWQLVMFDATERLQSRVTAEAGEPARPAVNNYP